MNIFEYIPQPIKQGGLKGKYKHNWIEETLEISRAEKPSPLAVSQTKKFLGRSIDDRRLFLLFAAILCGALAIIARVAYLQLLAGDHFRALAEDNRLRIRPLPAQRGIIYDRFNRELVQNVPNFSLALIPQDLPPRQDDRLAVLTKAAAMSSTTVPDLQVLINKYGSFGSAALVIKENLDYNEALKLYVENGSVPGIAVESGSRRKYLYTTGPNTPTSTLSLSHLLGYLGKLNDDELARLHDNGYLPSDTIGKSGLEKTYESELRGVYGQEKVEVNAAGHEQSVISTDPPTPGKNIILTIDLDAQHTLESLVKQTADKTGKRRISAIALNPQNGEILALVSWPSFDNNLFSQGIDQKTYNAYANDPDNPLFNRVVSGSYPPGSTAKLMISAAALQEKIITKDTSFNSVGGLHVDKWFFKDWKAGGHGITNVTKALAWSVNTFFYYVGGGYKDFVGLGIERIAKYLQIFGIGQKTGIDLPGEGIGFIPSKEWKKQAKGETWFVGDTYNLSIGQGDLLVTPLQDAVWTAAIANGGTIIQPHLVQKIVDPTTNSATTVNTSSRSTGIAPENISIVQEGMRDCVLTGSCKLLQTLPFPAAGKTGTAQWSHSHPTHAWFTSFAPYNNPQIVVTVMVEEGGEGATVAMPIARDFLAWWGKKYLKS